MVDAETGMRRYNDHFVDIIRYSLREYESPTEFIARISAVDVEIGMRRYNVHFVDIIPYLPSEVINNLLQLGKMLF